jgi:hypothetical protein
MPQLPLALALDDEFRPPPAPAGATAHGSVAAATSELMLSGEMLASASPLVGAVTSGVVASAAETAGSSTMTGSTSASAALASGLDTSGTELAETLADVCGSVTGSEVSGGVTLTSAVVGAVTTGCV